MKKILLTTAIAGVLAVSAFGQGSVIWSATGAHGLATFSIDGVTRTNIPAGNPANIPGFGQLNIAAYYAAAGTPTLGWGANGGLLGGAWQESANIQHQIAPLPGNTPATTFTLPTDAGNDTVMMVILAWTGTYTDWNTAYQAAVGNPTAVLLGWVGSGLSGGVQGWAQGTGAPNGAPPTAPIACVYGASGYAGLTLQQIPEPASLALAGLGAAAMLILRRRK